MTFSAKPSRYLIGLGSNMRVGDVGAPRAVLGDALVTLEDLGLLVHSVSPVIDTAPVGPSQRRYANAAALVETLRDPESLLALLKGVEHAYGRTLRGQRWRARPLDLDILLWSGGAWRSAVLQVPHPSLSERDFALGPASAIAPDWRDPASGLSLRALYRRLTKSRPLPR